MSHTPKRKRMNDGDGDGEPMAKKARGSGGEDESDDSYSDGEDYQCGYYTYAVTSVCKNVDQNDKHPASHRSFVKENVFSTSPAQSVCHHYVDHDGIMAAVIFMRLVAHTVLHANSPSIRRVHKSVSRAVTPAELVHAIDVTIGQSGFLDDQACDIITVIRDTMTKVFCTKLGVRMAGAVDEWCGKVSRLVNAYGKCDHVEIVLNVK